MFISKWFWLNTEPHKKPLFCKLFSAVAKWFNYMSSRLPKNNCLHMYWTCSRVGGARSETLQELPSARGFMETSLISNEVFSDLLCLIRFICNTWPFIYSVYFSSAFFFCNYCPHEEGFISLFFGCLFFQNPTLIHLRKVLMTKTPFCFLFPIIPKSFFFFFLTFAWHISSPNTRFHIWL